MFDTIPIIAILEDDERRCTAMRECLIDELPGIKLFFFDAAAEMIAWFHSNQAEVSLISLDHDLPIQRNEQGELIDFGTGLQVADFLATLMPTCPIILHTSNEDGARKMKHCLEDQGWPVSRVYPADDLEWIQLHWKMQVLSYDSVVGFYSQ